MNDSQILNIAAETGKLLLLGGAESFRIEETVERVGKALGATLTCYVTLTAVIVSTKNSSQTKVIKARPSGFNLQTVDEINTLSRNLESKNISAKQYENGIITIKHHIKDFSPLLKNISAGIVSVAPSLYGSYFWTQYILMFTTGVVGYSMYIMLKKRIPIPYSGELVSSFIIGVMTTVEYRFGIAPDFMGITLGSLMPLVPGLAITNSIREIINGEIIAGSVRAMDAILCVCALVIGIKASVELLSHI